MMTNLIYNEFMLAELDVHLFGHPRMEIGGKAVDVDTRKATALLAYLAVTGQSHSRDMLAALFWPDYDHTNARAALRRTLSALNKAIGEEHLVSDWETISLNRQAPLKLDVAEFRARLAECAAHPHPAGEVCPDCIPTLRAAADLYRGDFMEGFSLRDSAPFDEWQFLEAENLRREFGSGLERLSRGLANLGQYEAAVEAARRWLGLDPLLEEAHRQLMLLYARSGQLNAALRQYRECVRVLDEELGVAPLEETTRLYQQILERRIPATAAEKHPTAPAARAEAAPAPPHRPGVGRAAEWAALQAALNSGECRFMALVGEAGIGKTWLAEAFAAHAHSSGLPVLAGRCYPGEINLAYSPFIDAIRSRLAQPGGSEALKRLPAAWLSETAWLLPELAASSPGLTARQPEEGPAAQARFFEGLRQTLLALARGERTGLLVLEDLHLADSATLDFLTYLVRRVKAVALVVLGTWTDDGSPAALALNRLAAECERAGSGGPLPLRRFTAGEVAQIALASSPQLPPEALNHLQAEAEGLPFFVAEYLSAYREGKLADSGGDWALPHGVRDLLHARLAAVDETGRQLLATAAVIGRSFDFDSLQMASGRSEDETINGLEVLVARGLIHEERPVQPGGEVRYDFSHDKLRSLVYEETGLARRRLLHRRVAEALANRVRGARSGGMLASQIAHHYQFAGQDEQAAEYYAAAGEHARRLHANADALAHFQSALALGHPHPADLREAIGDLQVLTGDYAGALTSYEAAAAQYCSECVPRLEHKLGRLHARRGDWEIADIHFINAFEALSNEEEPGLRSQLFAGRSQAAAQRGQAAQALEYANQARQLADETGDWLAIAQANNILGILARAAGDPQAAHDHLERSLQAAERGDVPGARIAALNNLALVHGDLGQYGDAVRQAQTALELCVQQGDRHYEAALRDHLADFYHALGDSQAAMDQLEKAVKIFAEVGVENGQARPEIWKLSEW